MTYSSRDIIVAVDAGAKLDLWHKKLGHMNEKGMKVLLSKGKLLELKTIEHSLCESCIFINKKYFKKTVIFFQI